MTERTAPLAALFQDERVGRTLSAEEVNQVSGGSLPEINVTATQEDTGMPDGSITIDNITFELD